MRHFLQIAALVVLLAGCATLPYPPPDLHRAAFLERSVTQTAGTITATVAVPDEAETEALFGLPLYEEGIQPVWVEIHNAGATGSRVSLWSIDPDYFSPMEVAWMNRGGFSKSGKAQMERWFHDTAMERHVPSGERRAGFIYTNRVEGTKGFNLDVLTGTSAQSFTFFVPIPGFTPDYMLVNFENLYAPEDVIDVPKGDLTAIRRALEQLPCCSMDPSETQTGAPFNVLLIGSAQAVRRMLLRARWRETETKLAQNTTARRHRYLGRSPDGIFSKNRADGSERRELRLWLSPYRFESERVWLGQVTHDFSDTTQDPTDQITDPNMDSARNYLLQDVWYSQSLRRSAFVEGAPVTTPDAPGSTFTGASYFTDGLRVVLFLSETPVAAGGAQIIPWEQMNR